MRRSAAVLLLLLCSWSVFGAPRTRVIVSTDLSTGLQGGWRQWDDADDGWAVAMAFAEGTTG